MNPFKHKQLEEFTIEDCELYISRYPYGERISEVKSHLRALRKQQSIHQETDSPDIVDLEKNKKPQKEIHKSNGNTSKTEIKRTNNNSIYTEHKHSNNELFLGIVKNIIGIITALIFVIIAIACFNGCMRWYYFAAFGATIATPVFRWCGWSGW